LTSYLIKVSWGFIEPGIYISKTHGPALLRENLYNDFSFILEVVEFSFLSQIRTYEVRLPSYKCRMGGGLCPFCIYDDAC